MGDWKLNNECEVCGKDLPVPIDFDCFVECDNCGAEYDIEWDNDFNEETGEENIHWWIECRDKNVPIKSCYVDYRELRKHIDEATQELSKDSTEHEIIGLVMKKMGGKGNPEIIRQGIAVHKGG